MGRQVSASLLGLGAAVALAGLAGQARADLIDITQPNVRLSAVLGNQFRVGDKIFSVASNGFKSTTFNAADIVILAISNADPLSGQGFRLAGAFNDAPGGLGSDFVLAYTVEVAPEFIEQGFRINDIGLAFNGASSGTGSFSRVDETAMDANNRVLANASVFAITGQTTRSDDHLELGRALTRVNVVKDVQMFANGETGTAAASFVDQTISQIILIPLPSTAALGMLGLSGLVVRRRR